MIKAIIFDLNGVFIQSPRLSDRFKEDYGVPLDDFLSALSEIMTIVRKPNANDSFSYWEPYFKKWGVQMNRDQFFNYWFTQEKEVPELIEFAKRLKDKKLKLFILSNNFIERTSYYDVNFPFLKKVFNKIYYSWQTGFVKPDIGAFALILKENNLQGQECLYFDDSEKNIEVANSLGIIAQPYLNNQQLMDDINKKIL